MSLVFKLEDIQPEDRQRVGGKGFALAVLFAHGFQVPHAVCVSSVAYSRYLQTTGLGERIALELHRKNFEDMRWEELWDASLRIRNMFLNTPIPRALEKELADPIEASFKNVATVVRSSAPGEDSAGASFAGLHESYVNISGTPAILEHIRKVWASLWSDAALLYRQELGLDTDESTMAVVVQEIVLGERSGVAFCRNPNDPTQAVVEGVYGLNQGMVDGTVSPDRWILDRASKKVISHTPAEREKTVVPTPTGVRLTSLATQKAETPPLDVHDVVEVLTMALGAEEVFGTPQDVEWTYQKKRLFTLQSRPITTTEDEEGYYSRSWYLSLRRSYENLQSLRERIEGELIPEMIKADDRLGATDLTALSDHELGQEIRRRQEIFEKWERVYWEEFIPFAHGSRLFGQVYNDTVRPDDPYEFTELLGTGELVSMSRNRMLEEMAAQVRQDAPLRERLRVGDLFRIEGTFKETLEAFLEQFGEMSCHEASCTRDVEAIVHLVLELAFHPTRDQGSRKQDSASLKAAFLDHFEEDAREDAENLLDLARASYRLRDDDNIYLGRIEGQLMTSVREGIARLGDRAPAETEDIDPAEVATALETSGYVPKVRSPEEKPDGPVRIQARQLMGQPAGPGIATEKARVIQRPADLRAFKSGEILVCDAVDPNMTVVVPLAGAIVERRGGMLIHGAIIAREYGLPCVTGIPDATSLIQTGDTLTVDGYLGIVIIGDRAVVSEDQ